MAAESLSTTEAFSTFDQTGGRIGSGAVGSGQGGVARCAR